MARFWNINWNDLVANENREHIYKYCSENTISKFSNVFLFCNANNSDENFPITKTNSTVTEFSGRLTPFPVRLGRKLRKISQY